MKIDWNEQWKTMMSESMNNRGDSAAISCPRYWDTPERARDYLKIMVVIRTSTKNGRN